MMIIDLLTDKKYDPGGIIKVPLSPVCGVKNHGPRYAGGKAKLLKPIS
jgi:hypothetical protein